MAGRRLKLKTKSDFVTRLSEAPMLTALEELIWNAFDERAKTVLVSLVRNELDGVDRIEIRDDGCGLEYQSAAEAFENLGCSNKSARTLETGERLHGRKGEGRHKALSLGDHVVWQFTYDNRGKRFRYEINGTAGREDPFYLTEERAASVTDPTGCAVTITKIRRSLNQLMQPDARRELASMFAPFLLRHRDRSLVFDGKPIRPADAIAERGRIPTFFVKCDESRYEVSIAIIHWKEGHKRRDVQLCSENGIPLHRLTNRSVPANDDHSVFVRSPLFDLWHEQNSLSSAEMAADSGRREIIDRVWTKVRSYFRKRNQLRAHAALATLRDEGSYPYKGEPKTVIDKVERKVFDLCAININRHLPNFSEGMDPNGRRLLLRVVREAISQNPTSVGRIIREVCKLPEKEAHSFARLLEDVPLTNIVHLSSMVAERLRFLKLFEATVYLNPFEQVIKERTQLQKLLCMNTWLFGEEYALGTDDENLKTVLEKHVQILGREHLDPEVRDVDIQKWLTEYNKSKQKTPQSLDRIPDLMLWRRFQERRPDEYEFLVVEIKRPGVPIGRDEIKQIEDYADAVVKTPFPDSKRTRWVFVVVSDELDDYAEDRAHQSGMPAYTILSPTHRRYEIQARPWNQLIRSANARHDHLQKWLDYSVSNDRVFDLANETYAEFLPPEKVSVSGKPTAKKKRA